MFAPGMMGPGMMNPMMGGMMGGMMPGMSGPGMPFGHFNPRQMPGWFGRDMLGREFSGPGGTGEPSPYRPPDPAVLPPMPSGLPIMARPPKQGFDAYGRQIPPPLPAGIDGWGRPIPGPDGQFQFRPPGMMGMPGVPGMQGPGQPPVVPEPPAPTPAPAAAEQPERETAVDIGVTSDSGRPEEPPMFHRSPVTDSHNDFRDFTPFSFPSYALARIHRLRRPPELKHCDVRSDEWAYFIEALEQEAYRYADKSHLSTYGTYSQDDLPLLTEDVHQLLRAWQVGYFGPRGVQIYPAKNGKRLFAPGLPVSGHRGYGNNPALTITDDDDDSVFSDDTYDPREEAQYSARERKYRRRQRRDRRRELRERKKRQRLATDDWEVHFAWMQPTAWRAGMKPLQYGEKRPAIPRPDDY
ncbi:hypothetical protein FFLO_04026 [Filobasidium floriforme]|uniref:Uncharacterized protein n=1 Tax=Filobasidium floriforme TaxID=5210 RepID=A0A8K0JKZ1_9TREE|nr:hypothetical protein FFLO_04026 [Filobasidium floriforme]